MALTFEDGLSVPNDFAYRGSSPGTVPAHLAEMKRQKRRAKGAKGMRNHEARENRHNGASMSRGNADDARLGRKPQFVPMTSDFFSDQKQQAARCHPWSGPVPWHKWANVQSW